MAYLALPLVNSAGKCVRVVPQTIRQRLAGVSRPGPSQPLQLTQNIYSCLTTNGGRPDMPWNVSGTYLKCCNYNRVCRARHRA